MKKLLAALAAACLAGTALLAIPAFAATKTVTLRDSKFVPKTLSVPRGTTIRWVWRGKLPHNVVVKSGPVKFRSPLKKKGTYTRTLTRTGTYNIICEIHPGMTLKLRVS